MHQMRISTSEDFSVVLRMKNLEIQKGCENCEEPKKPKCFQAKLSQIRKKDKNMHDS
jgi:hypothetical protein